MTMQDSSTPEINRIRGGIRTRLAHESAEKHVSGAAVYTDDISEPEGMLHLYPFTSPHAHARIVSMDLRDVETAPGVVAVVGASDVPGTNDYSVTALKDDRVFSDTLVEYAGQVIFAVAAETRAQARDALALAKIEFEVLPAVLTVDQARASNLIHADPNTISRGDAKKAIAFLSRRASLPSGSERRWRHALASLHPGSICRSSCCCTHYGPARKHDFC